MSSPVFIVSASLLCLALGCGSDDAPSPTSGGGQAGASAAGSPTTGGSTGTSGSSTQAGTSTSGAAGANANAGSGGSTPLSEACQKYCECHVENCATTPIPDGKSCGDFCAAMTQDQLACRQNMCGLVPAQPNNNHCAHSVGIDECK